MSTQANTPDIPTIIRRSDKGLTISGTRVTLYALMDYLREDWAEQDIRTWLNLTEEQLRVALDYIAAHREAVEAEYAEVVQASEARRRYWEERLREHLANHPPAPPTPEKAALYAKLAEQRAQTLRDLAWEDEQGAPDNGDATDAPTRALRP
jgi:uncharacterized protein (DUF433 family)